MNPLWLLIFGMLVVVGSVLLLRLHVFLAMLLGALVVAALTPDFQLQKQALRGVGFAVTAANANDGTVTLSSPKRQYTIGAPLRIYRPAADRLDALGSFNVTRSADGVTIARGQPHPKLGFPQRGDLAADPAQADAAIAAARQPMGARVAEGFANTAKDIAILIAMASIIGEALLVSGSAERIVVACRRALGDKRAPLAFLASGFILGIPLFTVFYLLIPLAKVMRARSGRDYLLYVLAIVAGATMTHSLVPPAPGPLFVASALKVDLATMIAAGLAASAFAAIGGFGYALWANRRWDIPLRDPVIAPSDETQEMADADGTRLPSLLVAVLPIVLPVILIAAGEIAELVTPPTVATGRAVSESEARTLEWLAASALSVAKVAGEKNLALTLSAMVALWIVAVRGRRSRKAAAAPPTTRDRTVRQTVADALTHGGVIILITCAGGAFGYVLRQSDIATSVQEMVPAAKLSLIPLAWLASTLVRTAQGSATVAMITAAGIIAPIAAAGGLGYHPVYLAVAIGCGSKPIMWMNDSGFWIIGKVSGLTEGEMLKSATVMMAIMGVVGLCVTMLAAWVMPMA